MEGKRNSRFCDLTPARKLPYEVMKFYNNYQYFNYREQESEEMNIKS